MFVREEHGVIEVRIPSNEEGKVKMGHMIAKKAEALIQIKEENSEELQSTCDCFRGKGNELRVELWNVNLR